jgi:hypothetical protein
MKATVFFMVGKLTNLWPIVHTHRAWKCIENYCQLDTIHFERGWELNGRSIMDPDVTRDICATDENSVTNREGSSNGTKMTASIVSYEEVKRHQVAKNQACM